MLPAAYAVGDKAAHGSSGYAGPRSAAVALLLTATPLHPCPCRCLVVVVMVAIRQIKTNSFYLAGALNERQTECRHRSPLDRLRPTARAGRVLRLALHAANPRRTSAPPSAHHRRYVGACSPQPTACGPAERGPLRRLLRRGVHPTAPAWHGAGQQKAARLLAPRQGYRVAYWPARASRQLPRPGAPLARFARQLAASPRSTAVPPAPTFES